MLVPPNPVSNTTQTFRSIGLIIALAMVPLFIAAVVSWYVLDLLAGTGIATGFAVDYISTLKGMVGIWDQIIIFIFAVGFGATVVRSFLTNTHPVFGIVGLIFLPVVVFVAAYGANVFGAFTQLSFLQGALNQFPLSFAFFNNAALIAAGTGVLVLLVMVGGVIRQ